MKRREALRHIGLSAGYIAATPALFSLVQSCKDTKYNIGWSPVFLSKEEATALDQIVNLILPKTDTPGAREMNVPMFIDKYFNAVVSEEEGKRFKQGMSVALKELGGDKNVDPEKLTEKEYDAFLAKYLKIPREKQQEYRQQMGAIANPDDLKSAPRDAIVFNTLSAVRDMSIYAYRTSEYIGEQVLKYEPVPGKQIGCDSLETLTGGRAWSL